MPIDFAIYPPEINSFRMYTGPGPGPMLAAMQAWDAVADELYTAASAYQSAVSELIQSSWMGPSSASMAAAAEQNVRWLSTTAAQAEHTATQTRLAAAAYEAAFAATVPPAEVVANRAVLAMLVATNFFGQNTPAIAATEVIYAEMWAQDALAMYTYAASSAAATPVTPFTAPEQTIDPGATARQAAAVAGSAAEGANNAISMTPQALSVLAAPAAGEELGPLAALIAILLVAPGDFLGIIVTAPVDVLTGPIEVPGSFFTTFSGLLDDDKFSAQNGEKPWPDTGPAPVEPFPAPLVNPPPGGIPAPASAALGEAGVVGKLSVPPGWAIAAPEIRAVAATTELAETAAAAGTPTGSGLAAAMAGQAMVGPPPPATGQNIKPVTHARMSTRSVAMASSDRGAAPSAPRKVVTGVVAAIREIAKQRAEGMISDEEYNERKKILLEGSFGEPTPI